MNPTETEPILGGDAAVREPPPSQQSWTNPASNTTKNFWQQQWNSLANRWQDNKPAFQGKPLQSKRSRVGYNWQTYRPADNSWWHLIRWFVQGGSRFATVSDAMLYEELGNLARCLLLLRSYQSRFVLPPNGDIRDQEYVLRECVKDLYAGGAPLWSLESIMSKMAQGLTGNPYVNWFFLPRKAFVFAVGATTMFTLQRGFAIRKLDDMEAVTVRLASFASNTRGTSDVPSRFPCARELHDAMVAEEKRLQYETQLSQEDLAEEILDLASEGQGPFYFVNANGYTTSVHDDEVPNFWTITDAERDLFSRLACREAMDMIRQIDAAQRDALYSPAVVVAFRMVAAAGACGMWYHGSWYDMIVAGILAVVVAMIGEWSVLSKQEKLIFEVVASAVVGFTAGVVALVYPSHTCFSAIALSGIMDLMQGFRVVYAIIEVMSRNSVAGTSDLMEGLMFTGLVAYGMRTGQVAAADLFGGEGYTDFPPCSHSISKLWYLLWVPLAALAWSGLFSPNYADLPLMALHGVLGYGINFVLNLRGVNDNINNFVSAMSISLSSGIVSRFTGRQAIACTVAGLYVLLPGAYLVTSLYSTNVDNQFFLQIVQRAVVIGIGAWTGSMLCSPTLLGSTAGLLSQLGSETSKRDSTNGQTQTMLFF